MKKRNSIVAILTGCIVMILCGMKEAPIEDDFVETHEVISVEYVEPEAEEVAIVEVVEPVVVVEEPSVSEDEMELLALVTMAEAEGECEEGQRLVIDTILNRVDSGYFPDNITDVIYQKNQFTSMWNGRVKRCYVKDDIYKLVEEEIQNRTNYEVMFFTAGKYGKYGTPMFQVGGHYFSSYN